MGLLREDDPDPRAVGEGVIAGQAVLTGDEVHVTDERVGGLPERYLAANQQPRAGHIRVHVRATFSSAWHEQVPRGSRRRAQGKA